MSDQGDKLVFGPHNLRCVTEC